MTKYVRHIDWKVLLFALVACYAIPWLALGTISSAVMQLPSSWGAPGATVLMLIYFLAPPFAAGYFTARYAHSLPQLHVVIVSLFGLFATLLSIRASLGLHLAYGVAFVVLSALGAFVRLRGGQRNAV